MNANRHVGGTPDIAPTLAGPVAWTRDSLGVDAGQFALTRDCLAELDAVAAQLSRQPRAAEELRPGMFALDACTALMAAVRATLRDGVGFAIVDRLPVDRLPTTTVTALFWLLASLVARPVAQKIDGRMIYDVHDTGRQPGNGIRPDLTNVEQNYHNDNSYNLAPPQFVALLCLQTAASGGISRIVSLPTVHNIMRAQHPDLLPRLYEPFTFDRQREHGPNDAMTISHPLFDYADGRLSARLSRYQVRNGYALAGEAIDTAGEAALDALEAVMNRPDLCKEFVFEPGQIQIVDNARLGHKRTAFTDGPNKKRHLVRLWLRDWGGVGYNG